MALTTSIKNAFNKLLAPVGLRLDTLTEERQEQDRLALLEKNDQLAGPIYSRLPDFDESPLEAMIALYPKVASELERLTSGESEVRLDPDNEFYRTPDVQALYLLLRVLNPSRMVEVGSGHSTRIARQAIVDGGLDTSVMSIDPSPRVDIGRFSDEVLNRPLESFSDEELIAQLAPGDVLFVDSSHEVRTGNDVVQAVCRLLPALPRGVVIHFHDIFLPFEYPADFARSFPQWGEQYLLYAFLLNSQARLIWPGYLLQRDRPELAQSLPFMSTGLAQSFWFVL